MLAFSHPTCRTVTYFLNSLWSFQWECVNVCVLLWILEDCDYVCRSKAHWMVHAEWFLTSCVHSVHHQIS